MSASDILKENRDLTITSSSAIKIAGSYETIYLPTKAKPAPTTVIYYDEIRTGSTIP
jgi:hypothetical protein